MLLAALKGKKRSVWKFLLLCLPPPLSWMEAGSGSPVKLKTVQLHLWGECTMTKLLFHEWISPFTAFLPRNVGGLKMPRSSMIYLSTLSAYASSNKESDSAMQSEATPSHSQRKGFPICLLPFRHGICQRNTLNSSAGGHCSGSLVRPRLMSERQNRVKSPKQKSPSSSE